MGWTLLPSDSSADGKSEKVSRRCRRMADCALSPIPDGQGRALQAIAFNLQFSVTDSEPTPV